MRPPLAIFRLLLFLVIFNLISSGHSYTLWDWQDRQRRRVERQSKRLILSDHQSKNNDNVNDKSDEDDNNEIQDEVPTLNVSSKDSPYALIDRFFPERERNHGSIDRKFQQEYNATSNELGNLRPNEVWLSDGDLLVLKGGSTPDRKGYDNPWKPLDDYVAPYREPKLPPLDFIPSDTGVGVALPPEEEPVVETINLLSKTSTPKPPQSIKRNPFKKFLFDEEKFIAEMENFHSKRRDEIIGNLEIPKLQINLVRFPTTPAPTPFPRSQTPTLQPTTPFPRSQTPTLQPFISTTPGYFVSTSTPNSFSYAYLNEIQQLQNQVSATPPSIARSTTTSTTTTTKQTTTTTIRTTAATTPSTQKPIVRELKPRAPKSFYVKPKSKYGHYGQKTGPNEIDIDNKVAEERHDHYFAKRPPNWPIRARRKSFFGGSGPTLASTVISSLKPRYYNSHNSNRHFLPIHPRRILPTPSTRRISNGDHRYVSFYRSQLGGKSWGYSYHLK